MALTLKSMGGVETFRPGGPTLCKPRATPWEVLVDMLKPQAPKAAALNRI